MASELRLFSFVGSERAVPVEHYIIQYEIQVLFDILPCIMLPKITLTLVGFRKELRLHLHSAPEWGLFVEKLLMNLRGKPEFGNLHYTTMSKN